MPSVAAKILEEQWTSTTIKAAFAFEPPHSECSGISIDFPLHHLGWTFRLLLAGTSGDQSSKKSREKLKRSFNWTPVTLSFRQPASTVLWQNTSFRAELSLERERTDAFIVEKYSIPFGAMDVALTDTPSNSLQVPVAASCTISALQLYKVWLTVTVSECPFPNGLFDARSGTINEAEIQVQLVRQSGDRVLNQSLSTGKLFDLKFLTNSTRPTSGSSGDPLPTYASLVVLEKHIDLSSSVLRDSWANALAMLDNTSANQIEDPEILRPKDYEYELDSDFDDNDEASTTLCESQSGGDDLATVPEDIFLAHAYIENLTGQQSENGTDESNNSLSSFEPVGEDSVHGSVDHQLEELVKGPKEPQEPPCNHERMIWVGFAAHRTWRAFLWYCYTGRVEFGKLRSQVEFDNGHLRETRLEGTCSPKSMYRLADLVGNKELKAKALVAIKERLTETNVLDESFSVFTSKYPDVREAQLDVLMEHCGSPHVKNAFLRAMGKYASMSHAEPVLSAFYDKLVGETTTKFS